MYRMLCSAYPGRGILCRVKKIMILANMNIFLLKSHRWTISVKTGSIRKACLFHGAWIVSCVSDQKLLSMSSWIARTLCFIRTFSSEPWRPNLPLIAYKIRYLPVENTDPVSYDLTVVIGFHTTWLSRKLYVMQTEMRGQCVTIFAKASEEISEVYKTFKDIPDWLAVLYAQVTLKWVCLLYDIQGLGGAHV